MATPDRWAPWTEGVLQTADLVLTTGAPVVPGLTLTFTPHINTRLLISACVTVQFTAFGAGSNARVYLNLNGVFLPPATQAGSLNVEYVTLTPVAVVNLVAGTTYTVDVRARLAVAGSVATALSGGGLFGGMTITALPNLHT